MTLQQLRAFLGQHWCLCGFPEEAAKTLLHMLRLCPLYDHREEWRVLTPNEGIQHLILYMLDRMDLIEHGHAIQGSWLTSRGEQVRDALARYEAEDFASVFPAGSGICIHGYDMDTERCPECQPSNPDTAV